MQADAGGAVVEDFSAQNAQLRLAFRRKTNAAASADAVQVRSRFSETWADGIQRTFDLVHNTELQVFGVRETEGMIADFPRALRAKRGAPTEENDIRIHHAGNYADRDIDDVPDVDEGQLRASRRRRVAQPAAEGETASAAPLAGPASDDARERLHANINIWRGRTRNSTVPPVEASAPRKKKSARKSAPTGNGTPRRSKGTRRASAGGPDTPAAPARVPVVKAEIDSVNDLFSGIELASLAGSESTRIFSRASSEATTTAEGHRAARMM